MKLLLYPARFVTFFHCCVLHNFCLRPKEQSAQKKSDMKFPLRVTIAGPSYPAAHERFPPSCEGSEIRVIFFFLSSAGKKGLKTRRQEEEMMMPMLCGVTSTQNAYSGNKKRERERDEGRVLLEQVRNVWEPCALWLCK